MSEPGALMAAEIAEQPEVLRRILADTEQVAAARRRVEKFRPRFVLLAARGTSDHAALYAKYLVEIERGLPAGLVSPSTITVYGARPDLSGTLLIAVSQSGSSHDLVETVEYARSAGALTIAVTNAPTSPLAAAAEVHVDVRAGAETAVAATKSYTAQLLTLQLLLGHRADTAVLPDRAEETLAAGDIAAVAGRYRFAERLITTARGYSYPTAREAALKLMETSYVSAQAFSAADLLHGPLAMIDNGIPVLAVVSPGRGGAAMGAALERLAERGADLLTVGARGGLRISSDGVAEALLPVLEILPLQQLAWRLSLDRGGDPDRPRGLSKVTSTR